MGNIISILNDKKNEIITNIKRTGSHNDFVNNLNQVLIFDNQSPKESNNLL